MKCNDKESWLALVRLLAPAALGVLVLVSMGPAGSMGLGMPGHGGHGSARGEGDDPALEAESETSVLGSELDLETKKDNRIAPEPASGRPAVMLRSWEYEGVGVLFVAATENAHLLACARGFGEDVSESLREVQPRLTETSVVSFLEDTDEGRRVEEFLFAHDWEVVLFVLDEEIHQHSTASFGAIGEAPFLGHSSCGLLFPRFSAQSNLDEFLDGTMVWTRSGNGTLTYARLRDDRGESLAVPPVAASSAATALAQSKSKPWYCTNNGRCPSASCLWPVGCWWFKTLCNATKLFCPQATCDECYKCCKACATNDPHHPPGCKGAWLCASIKPGLSCLTQTDDAK